MIEKLRTLCTVFGVLGVVAGAANAQSCAPAAVTALDGRKFVEVGEVWSGVRVAPGAAADGEGRALVAYYDANRQVRLARVDVAAGQVCDIRFDSRFGGWDAHNALKIALAPDGTVHIAGNAHASPLFYARGRAEDVGSVLQMPMLGRDEDHATYPTFLRAQDGSLLFAYRNGRSGDGVWIVNRWQDGSWTRLGTVFGAQDGEGRPVSAYPSPIVTDADGVSHVAIVWRRTADVATNFEVSYARTRDFVHWSSVEGAVVAGPVLPGPPFTVTAPGPDSGLLNNAQLLLAPDGTPLVFFTRYGAAGNDALTVARPGAAGWEVRDIVVSDRKTSIGGGGSLPNPPRFSVAAADGQAVVRVVFPGKAAQVTRLDLATLTRLQDAPGATADPVIAPPLQVPAGLEQARVWSMTVTTSGYDGPGRGSLYWFAQNPNRDRKRSCSPSAPQACDPPASPLLWLAP